MKLMDYFEVLHIILNPHSGLMVGLTHSFMILLCYFIQWFLEFYRKLFSYLYTVLCFCYANSVNPLLEFFAFVNCTRKGLAG
uniref:Uncharacterized protein n=2 Tax=Anguilla anguilla TaxID=7936 RepID=A0A0E9T147_ANGAN